MKTLCSLILFVIFITVSSKPQQASDYFPVQTGFTWYYTVTPLDSSNNPIDPLTFYRADSFAVVTDYNGMLADVVYSKRGEINTLPFQPYMDSLFYHFDGANAFEYLQTSTMEYLLRSLDSLSFDPNFSFLDFFTSLENWYSVYRFDQPLQNNYTFLSIDTTLYTTVMTLPLRFEYIGERLGDETISTLIGNFNCKKFLIKKGVSLIITPTYLIPLAFIEETVWLAPENWIVKSFIPSTFVDLSLFGADPIVIPGLKTDIIQSITDVEEIQRPSMDYFLSQNYPNPFNPSTKIKFKLSESEFVSLKVFDVLGKEVATIINEDMFAGEYVVRINGENLASGSYFLRLQAGEFVDIKKMILLK